MKFSKMQGAGNDFVLVESENNYTDWQGLSIAMCDRHFGIGADGLLVMMPSDSADFKMRIFNADGSESEACGNGLRCMVKYFADNTGGRVPETIRIETIASIREAELTRNNDIVSGIRINMGKPLFGESEIPVKEGKCKLDINNIQVCVFSAGGLSLKLNLVSVGNPHAVYFTDIPVCEFPLDRIGPEVSGSQVFPAGINFEVVRIIDKETLEARVWERGVGETLACGSGACAICAIARLSGFIGDTVDIVLPGGVLNVEWDGCGDIFLSGPAETVFTGIWDE